MAIKTVSLREFSIAVKGMPLKFEHLLFSEKRKICNKAVSFFKGSFDYGGFNQSGERWYPLSPVTVRRKGHSKILHETGALRDMIIGVVGADKITVTTFEELKNRRRSYAAIHNEGSYSGNKFIPKRQFMGNSPVLERQIEEDLRQILMKTFAL